MSKLDVSTKRKNSDPETFENNETCLDTIESQPEDEEAEEPKGLWAIWPFTHLIDRPILRLFLVIFSNGILSNIFSTIFLNIEKPAQDVSHIINKIIKLLISIIYIMTISRIQLT